MFKNIFMVQVGQSYCILWYIPTVTFTTVTPVHEGSVTMKPKRDIKRAMCTSQIIKSSKRVMRRGRYI
jgi:hypothetical protein